MPTLKAGVWTKIECTEEAIRADTFLARQCEISRARVQKLIEENLVKKNGQNIKSNLLLNAGDSLEIFLPEPKSLDIKAEEIPLTVYYQDKDIAVIEKPAGLVVHPAVGNWEGTLVNALLHQFGSELSKGTGIAGKLRPGIVHRIDKNTSGILLVTKTDDAHMEMCRQFKEHSISRSYLGLCYGKISESGKWSGSIARDPKDRKRMAITEKGRSALTEYKKISDHLNILSFFRATLHTGRTHQIRVHFSAAGFPLVGDEIYGNASRASRQKREESARILQKKAPEIFSLTANLQSRGRQFLHAAHLGFIHPITKEPMEFNSPLPLDLKEIMLGLEKWKE